MQSTDADILQGDDIVGVQCDGNVRTSLMARREDFLEIVEHAAVELDTVIAPEVRNHVVTESRSEHKRIVSDFAREDVVSRTAFEAVVSGASVEDIVPSPTDKDVVAAAAALAISLSR